MNIIKIAKAAIAVVTVGVAAVGAVWTAKNTKKLHQTAVESIQKAENNEIESDEEMQQINKNLLEKVGDVVFDAGSFLAGMIIPVAALLLLGYFESNNLQNKIDFQKGRADSLELMLNAELTAKESK